MLKRLVLAVLFIPLLALAKPGVAQEIMASEGCMLAMAELDDFLLAQPNTCNMDEDCGGFYFRLDTCSPPVMLPVEHVRNREFMKVLVQAQMNARSACAADFASRPQCKPKPYMPACRGGVCVNDWARHAQEMREMERQNKGR